MRKHLYILGLMASPWCRSCRPEEEITAHVLWECEALATLKSYLSVLLNLSLGANGTLLKGQDDLDFSLQEYKGPVKGPCASGPNRLEFIVFSVLFYSITLHIE